MTSLWVRGSKPQRDTLKVIVAGTGCSRAWLEDDIGEPFPAGGPAPAAAEALADVSPPPEARIDTTQGVRIRVHEPLPPGDFQEAANVAQALEPVPIAGGHLVDAESLADLVRAARRKHGQGMAYIPLAEHVVPLYMSLYPESDPVVIPGALAAVLGAALERYPDVDKACRKAVEFYELAVQAKVLVPGR